MGSYVKESKLVLPETWGKRSLSLPGRSMDTKHKRNSWKISLHYRKVKLIFYRNICYEEDGEIAIPSWWWLAGKSEIEETDSRKLQISRISTTLPLKLGRIHLDNYTSRDFLGILGENRWIAKVSANLGSLSLCSSYWVWVCVTSNFRKIFQGFPTYSMFCVFVNHLKNLNKLISSNTFS